MRWWRAPPVRRGGATRTGAALARLGADGPGGVAGGGGYAAGAPQGGGLGGTNPLGVAGAGRLGGLAAPAPGGGRAICGGPAAAGSTGIRSQAASHATALPADVRDYPEAVSQALNQLRLESVDGPYSLALSADLYSQVAETSNHGSPIRQHIARILDGEIVWAPAITGAFLISTRGGDFELTIGQDVSIGYDSHDGDSVNLYFQESFTFLTYTPEAVIPLTIA